MDPTEQACLISVILIVAALLSYASLCVGYSFGRRHRRVPSRRILFRPTAAADPVGDLLAERIRFGNGR